MDIGFVVHHYDPADGTGGYAVQLLERIAREHEVTLYAARAEVPTPASVRVVRVPALGGSAYGRILSFPAAFAAVRRRHEVVHAQGWVATSAEVVTTHIVLGAWRDAARQAGIVSPPGERLLGGFVARREGALVRRARLAIAPSRRAAEDIRRCYRRDDAVVIHHGFPPATPLPAQDEARRQFGLPAVGLVALYAGDARKGFDRAAEAIAQTPGVQLLVASRSRPDPYLARARALGVGDRIHWAGGLADVRLAYAAADLLLHPTIYDTFAMVVAEAMAYGVPVIVSRDAGVTDLIQHRRSGWILEPNGPSAAAALAAFRDDARLRLELAEGGRAAAAGRTWDHVAQETLAVYRRAAGKP